MVRNLRQSRRPRLVSRWEPQRTTVERRGWVSPLLPRSIPHLQLDSLVVHADVLDLEVDADCGDERGGERVVRVAQEQTRFPLGGVEPRRGQRT
eukprot:scaffold2623_cov250-Pinguiococcus_pyrenoidosus.AAC.1